MRAELLKDVRESGEVVAVAEQVIAATGEASSKRFVENLATDADFGKPVDADEPSEMHFNVKPVR